MNENNKDERMKYLKTLIYLLLFTAISTQAQNGKIIERKAFSLKKNMELFERITEEKEGSRILLSKYQYLDSVVMEEIFYMSDGLKVKAYLAYPKNSKNNIRPLFITEEETESLDH